MHSRKRLPAGKKSETSASLTTRGASIQRRSNESSGGLMSSRILQLQKAYGNQAVMQMLRDKQTIQRYDEQEEESEELQMKKDPIQRYDEQEEESEELQMKKDPIQRYDEQEEESEEALQMKAGSGKMPESVQAKMEGAFGHDFSNVKIHANSSKASEVGALAYTQGSDLHFAPGQYNPGSKSGQELLGHELTHVIQQSQGRVKPTMQLSESVSVNDDPGLESEADVMGKKAASYSNEDKAPGSQ